jgi:hypothetical protein
VNPTGWQVIDAERGVLWREYNFTTGAWATTLVFRGPEGLVVVSPACGLGPADYDALGPYGEVRALVANNAAHHLGQAAWRERFPEARSYADPRSLERLAQVCPGVAFEAVSALDLGDRASVHALAGYKSGELLISVALPSGALWYTGDLLTNIQRTPGPPFSWLFRWSGSAPGFKLFKLGVWRSVRDRPALRRQLEGLLAADPPEIIVPAHGPPVQVDGLPALVKAEIGKL